MNYLHPSNKLYFSFLCALLCFLNASKVSAQLFNQDSLKLISRQFTFTEGPAVNAKGDVYFTDQPNNKIWKYDTNGKLSLFMDKAGRANGTYFDKQGKLLVCADENNELWSVSKNKKVKVLLSTVDGKKMNGPNDLWADAKGGIYFTDPYYQRDYWTRKKPEIEGQKVYYLPPGKKSKVRIVAEDVAKPNGTVGSMDGKYLYVADIQRKKIYRYIIGENGDLSGQTPIINQVADGMTVDSKGNIYLAGNGVTIFNPEGVQIGHIDIKEPWTSNVCFGGRNRSELFITASAAIYTIPVQVKGIK